MLKLLSSSFARQLHTHFTTSSSPSTLSLLAGSTRKRLQKPFMFQKAFFCSPGDSHEAAAASDNYRTKTVLVLPLPDKPLIPALYHRISVKSPKLLAAIQNRQERKAPYFAAFLVKDEPGTDPSMVTDNPEKNIYDLKGKDLLNRLHEVGTLAKICSTVGDHVTIAGYGRVRITKMVRKDPLTVKVDLLEDKPCNKDDDIVKAVSSKAGKDLYGIIPWGYDFEDDFNCSLLADFGAYLCHPNKLLLQEVLEELDVYKRLKLTMKLMMKNSK